MDEDGKQGILTHTLLWSQHSEDKLQVQTANRTLYRRIIGVAPAPKVSG